jgi:DNA-binding CsgD family transcriptional regulator
MTDDDLLHLVYDAAIEPSRWPEVLAALGAKFGFAAAALFDQRFVNNGQMAGMKACLGYADEIQSSFAAYFRHRDIRLRRIIPRVATGHVYLDDRDIAFAEIEATEIHNDFYRRNGVGHIGAFILTNEPGQFSCLSIHRSLRFGAFTGDEAALLDRIAPHVVRAWRTTTTLRQASDGTRALMAAIGTTDAAVFVIDAAGTVGRMSPAAEQIARAGDCLRVRHNKLEAVNPADNAALGKLLAAAAAAPAVGVPPDRATLVLRSPAGANPIALFLAPVFPGAISGEPLVLVFANDPRAARPPDPVLVARQFGLSKAEARVAVALSTGLTVAEMAERLAVSPETIRTHLKRAMAKCDARSQAALVRVVLGSLGTLRRA